MIDYDAKAFGEKVRERRKQLNLSGRDLAEHLDINQSTVNRVENGKSSDVATFVKLMAWLGSKIVPRDTCRTCGGRGWL